MRLKDLSTSVLVSSIWNYLVKFGLYTQSCVSKTYFLEKAHFYFTRKTLYSVLKFLRECARERRTSLDFVYSELPAFDCVIDFINRSIRAKKTGSFPQFLSMAEENRLLQLTADFDLFKDFGVNSISNKRSVF